MLAGHGETHPDAGPKAREADGEFQPDGPDNFQCGSDKEQGPMHACQRADGQRRDQPILSPSARTAEWVAAPVSAKGEDEQASKRKQNPSVDPGRKKRRQTGTIFRDEAGARSLVLQGVEPGSQSRAGAQPYFAKSGGRSS